MIEIFKTNVTEPGDAELIIETINYVFKDCSASFDLEDCDRILRIQSENGKLCLSLLIALVDALGFSATVIPDEP